MVRQDGEMTAFKHVAEDSHGRVDCQALHAVGAIFLLRRAEFPGEGEGM